MSGARRPALSVAAGLLALALLASGCGSSGTTPSGTGSTGTEAPRGASARGCPGAPAGAEGLRVSGTDCASGRDVVARWTAKSACATSAGASRTSCTAGGYRCLGAATQRGIAVSCARLGRSVSFVIKHG